MGDGVRVIVGVTEGLRVIVGVIDGVIDGVGVFVELGVGLGGITQSFQSCVVNSH